MSRRRLAILASLAGLSALVMAMVAVRVVYTGNDYFTNLVWNLFLAWIPLGLAVYAYDGYRKGQGRLRLWAAGGLWLLFFPNALYIVTDFKWLNDGAGAPIWYDIVLWQLWDKVRCPTLILRGADSDLLEAGTVAQMLKRGHAARAGLVSAVEIAGCGHAPALMDADQINIVMNFLFSEQPGAQHSAPAGASAPASKKSSG